MAEKTARRNIEILRQYAGRPPQARSHRVALRFMRSPVEVIGDDAGHVTGLRVAHNRIEKSEDGRLRAVRTEEEEVIECGLLVRCIGYRGAPVPGVPFDEARGVIRNKGGRVIDAAGLPQRGEYAVGWIKRGPNGVIGTNKKCAAETVALILEDRAAGRLGRPLRSEREEVDVWLRERLDNLVTWDGWGAIEAHELAAGEQRGRTRVKLVKVSEMHEVAATARRR
jgi:ferredoxin--NADP+ reductase